MITRRTENAIIGRALRRLGGEADDLRPVLIDLMKSGFREVDELVELAQLARESVRKSDHNVVT